MTPDKELFKEGFDPNECAKAYNTTFSALTKNEEEVKKARRLRLMGELASLTKRFINEKITFEALLSERGIKEFSNAIYCIDYSRLYYYTNDQITKRNQRGYWKTLGRAIINKKDPL